MAGSRADAWVVTGYTNKGTRYYWNGEEWVGSLIVLLNNRDYPPIDTKYIAEYTVSRYIFDIDVTYGPDEQPVEADFTWTPRSRCPFEHPQT